MSTTETSELQALFTQREFKSPTLGLVKVLPFRFGDFAKVFAIIANYAEFLATDEFIQLMLQEGEDAIAALSQLVLLSCRDITAQDLADLPGDEAIDLIFQVFEVNADFFVRKIQMGASNLSLRLETLKILGESSSVG